MKTEDALDEKLGQFLVQHRLPDAFLETATSFYLPLAREIQGWRQNSSTLVIGINGAQGTGKSTLAEFLAMAADLLFGWHSAVLSIDDFYLTRSEREGLAAEIHPLLQTRGVPGTHDVELLRRTLTSLGGLESGETFLLPRFDKSIDDRAPESEWPSVEGPLDLVILEGWCVGSTAGDRSSLDTPVNDLERDEDADGHWRQWVEQRLRDDYESIFATLDRLVMLAAPSWDAVFRWRLEQEEKLAARTGGRGHGLMKATEVARFIQHYERITRRNLRGMPSRADVVLMLDEDHSVIEKR